MIDQNSLLETAKSYLMSSVAPKATEIDHDTNALQQALKGLAELGLLGLRIPQEWGGFEVSQETFDDFQELVARYSGALAFLQSQHQGAGVMLSRSENLTVKQEYLPLMSQGKLLLGASNSHWRRANAQPLKAFPKEGGYHLEGKVPWASGWDILDELIVVAALPSGDALFGIIPFRESVQDQGGAVSFTEPVPLGSMTSTNTVSVILKQWFLPENLVVDIKSPSWMAENDQKRLLTRFTFSSMGCAHAALDIVETATQKNSLPFIKDAFEALSSELDLCRTSLKKANNNPDLDLAEKHKLRAWTIDLAWRCTLTAITISKGAANLVNHPAQRIYREAVVFAVSGQTEGIMQATLERLAKL
jgi:alkylation response protein AidB-like acyl-CoA dehydrogenase